MTNELATLSAGLDCTKALLIMILILNVASLVNIRRIQHRIRAMRAMLRGLPP